MLPIQREASARRRAALAVPWMLASIGVVIALGGLARSVETEPAAGFAIGDSRILEPDRLIEALDEGGTAYVIVTLAEPAGAPGVDAVADLVARAGRRAAIAEQSQRVLAALDEDLFRVRYVYENQPGFAGAATREGIARLLESPSVVAIEVAREIVGHTAQGIPAMNATLPRMEFGGRGVSVAVCDSGIDYTHPLLGGGGFPNDKVIGGIDFGDGDDDPMDPNGHGTGVAGIIAAPDTDEGDFVGGVAPEAKLYAVRMTTGGGLTTDTSALVAAWDWIVSHQFDDPQNPIYIINTSLGGGGFAQACDGFVIALDTAARIANAAGITIFSSAGNDGLCAALAVPACLTKTISVGSVYDQDGLNPAACVSPLACEKILTGGCATQFACGDGIPESRRDEVRCNSNSAPFLDILTPGHRARTTGPLGGFQDLGATSAATAYASGAAAILQNAGLELFGAPLDSRSLRTLLTETGIPQLDPKADVETPRVDLAAALAALGPVAYCHGQDNEFVLAINGQRGLRNGGVAEVVEGGPILFSIDRPSGDTNDRFVVHLNRGAPDPATVVPLPAGLGRFCFPLLIDDGANPVAVWNNIGFENRVGESMFFGNAIADPPLAPADFFDAPNGDPNLPIGTEWTLQGAIVNSAARSRKGVSVTNAVLLRVVAP